MTDEVKHKFTEKVRKDPTELAGQKVKQVVRTDGLKLIFDDGSWVCYRLSGTEPVVRVYTEARDEQRERNADGGCKRLGSSVAGRSRRKGNQDAVNRK